MIIEKDCDQKIQACNKMNFSSNSNEVIRAVLNSFFLQKDFACTKSTKSIKSTKSTKRHQDATKQKQKTQISEQLAIFP